MLKDMRMAPPALVTELVDMTPLFLLFWYLIVTHTNLAAYVHWTRFQEDMIGRGFRIAYLLFVILSTATFWLATGPLLFYANKYRMGTKDRNKKLGIAIAVFFTFSDIPLFFMDQFIRRRHGWLDEVQCIALLNRSISFFGNTILVWFAYLWFIAKALHQYYDVPEDLDKIQEREQRKLHK